MKNILLALGLIISFSACAAEINFLDNPKWETVLVKAKKENKLIFLNGYASWCNPCKKMDDETYKDQAVANYFNTNFINVKYDMENEENIMLDDQITLDSYSTLAFINFKGEIVYKGFRFCNATDFLELGKKIKDPSTQNYYKLKQKVQNWQSNGSEFLQFAIMAAQFQDEDLSSIVEGYLTKSKFTISEKSQIIKNIDFNAVKSLLNKYFPEKSFFLYHYFRAQVLLENQDAENSVAEFDILLSSSPEKVDFNDLCEAMMNFSPAFEKSTLTNIITKFEAVSIPQKYAHLSYMKDWVKVTIYNKTANFDKLKPIANKLIASKDTPEDEKDRLKIILKLLNSKKN